VVVTVEVLLIAGLSFYVMLEILSSRMDLKMTLDDVYFLVNWMVRRYPTVVQEMIHSMPPDKFRLIHYLQVKLGDESVSLAAIESPSPTK
jgi:hypothetical protein